MHRYLECAWSGAAISPIFPEKLDSEKAMIHSIASKVDIINILVLTRKMAVDILLSMEGWSFWIV